MSGIRLVYGNTETPIVYNLHNSNTGMPLNDVTDLKFSLLDASRTLVPGSEVTLDYLTGTAGDYQGEMPAVSLELNGQYEAVFHSISVGYRREYPTTAVPN